jgi:hypothetical protein
MSQRLLSEGFEHAAFALQRSLDNFGGIDSNALAMVIRDFERQVDRLRDIFGMQAENMQRAAIGASMAYTEENFQNI